jgi:hypothetical protein
MRWSKRINHEEYSNGTVRCRRIFLWFPLSFDNIHYRWLEYAWVIEKYSGPFNYMKCALSPGIRYVWIKTQFHDGGMVPSILTDKGSEE